MCLQMSFQKLTPKTSFVKILCNCFKCALHGINFALFHKKSEDNHLYLLLKKLRVSVMILFL